jgi:carboxymethylenebutenolidase
MDTGLDRRSFLCGAAAVLGVRLAQQAAAAQQVPPDDGRLMSERVKAPAGLLVRPRPRAGTGVFMGPERYASVLVVHETRALDAWVEDVARRLALESFMVFAPGTRGIEELHESAIWLKKHQQSTGRLGLVAFSSTGNLANTLTARLGKELNAQVSLDGNKPIDEAAWQRAALGLIKSLT